MSAQRVTLLRPSMSIQHLGISPCPCSRHGAQANKCFGRISMIMERQMLSVSFTAYLSELGHNLQQISCGSMERKRL